MRRAEKKLIRYMRGTNEVLNTWILIVGICLMIVILPEERGMWIFYLVVSIVMLFILSMRGAYFRVDIRAARRTGEMQEYIDDFSSGVYYLGKELCLGEKYLFARGAGIPILYDDIQMVYMKPGERERKMLEIHVCVACKDGKTTKLCTTRVNCEKDEQVNELTKTLHMIEEKNPEIQVGFAK